MKSDFFVFLVSINRGYFLCYTFPFVSFNHISSQRFGELKIMYSSRMMKVCTAMLCISLSRAHFFCHESLKVGPSV